MSDGLHERLVTLVTEIYDQEKDTFEPVPYTGRAWEGRPPTFSEPIAITGLVFDKDPSSPRGFTLVKAILGYDDSEVGVGKLIGEMPDNDPMGLYFLENVAKIYRRHPHQICMDAIAALRPKSTPLGTGYNERMERRARNANSD